MAQYSDTLLDMVGRVVRTRAGIDRSLARDFLNDRMRTLLDRRPYWSGLLARTVLPIPTQTTLGTIALTTGSPLVTGTGTNWPVADAVATIIVEGVNSPGAQWVTPAQLTGITTDTMLYVDGTGSPETVIVQQVRGGRILVAFSLPHNPGFTATASSLAGLQLRCGYINPVFTVAAVTSPTTLLLDTPWGAASLSGAGYQILRMYTTFAPDVKQLLMVADPVQGINLRVNVQQAEVNQGDPNRMATDSPCWIVSLGPNPNGNMLYEIYPPQSTARQLYVMYSRQWPDMALPSDRPPSFLNPSLLVMGALADAFRTPMPRPGTQGDPGFNLDVANTYEQRFEAGAIDAIVADEAKALTMFEWDYSRTSGMGGANYWQAHDPDAQAGNY